MLLSQPSQINPPKDATFGDRVRFYRASLRLSQSALGTKVGVHTAYISDIENGKKRPKIELQARLAHALGCTIADLNPETLVQKETGAELVLIRSVADDILVGRTADDRIALEKLGHRVGIRFSQSTELALAALEAGVGLAIRFDLPVANLMPSDNGTDGLGPEYRTRLYRWVARFAGDMLSPNAKEAFRRAVIDEESYVDIAVALSLSVDTVRTFQTLARKVYGSLLDSPKGREFAAALIRELARPVEKRRAKSAAVLDQIG
jgi:transcriptional regulator with XRE-family HTH domain